MAKRPSRPNPPATPTDDSVGPSLEDLLEMVRQSARRTEQALSTPPVSFSVTEAVTAASARLLSNPPDVVERRLRRRGLPTEQARDLAAQNDPSRASFEVIGGAPEGLGLERIIGRDMLMPVSYLEAGHRAARCVARIVLRDARGHNAGYGTGFLVSPRLLLTNNHVLTSAAAARRGRAEFDYQHSLGGGMMPSVVVDLDPDLFFVTSPMKELDFTLVGVKERAESGRAVEEFGYHPLTALEDEVLAGECVTVIQHPRGDPKQIALRENEVLRLPRGEDHFLHYQTDTHPGSSGSPVFNDGWEVVALHHSGKPETDEAGNVLTVDGQVWQAGMALDRIRWVANEGIRVKAIVEHVRRQPLTAAQKKLFEAALVPTTHPRLGWVEKVSQPSPTASEVPAVIQAPSVAAAGHTVVVTIPLEVSVRFGTAVVRHPTLVGASAAPAEEAISIDPNYGNREGYDPEFLGAGARAVPLPRLTAAMEVDAAVNREAVPGASPYELPYHHFSIALNRKRRLAYFTAVNIDGRLARSPAREKDRWFYDPRIGRQDQAGDELYSANPFDRGHLVRRLDPAWGRSRGVALAANDDTFHFTNCGPQHERFNQGKNLWAGLEDYLLNRAADERKRLTVFTGPVFAADDPVYRTVAIPRQYWKVAVVAVRGRLLSTAYLVSQADLIRPVVEEVTPAEVARLFQVRVRRVEELTGLDFGELTNLEAAEATGSGERELERYEDIELGV